MDDEAADKSRRDPAAQAIRRQASRLARHLKALEAVQRSLPAPTREELLAMMQGKRPISLAAYRIGRLQWASTQVEEAVQDLREIARPEVEAWLSALFKKRRLPSDETLRYIAGALGYPPPPRRRQ
jgi:hypothetical protein